MDFRKVFEAVRAERNKPQNDDLWCPAIDEAALVIAHRIRDRLSDFPITLSFNDWTRLTARIQSDVAVAIRHSIYDPEPAVGGLQRDRFDPYNTDRYPPKGTPS